MKYDRLTRRQFLQGTGGFLLSIPLLPSLLSPEEAAASCFSSSLTARYITLYGRYGCVAHNRWLPDRNTVSFNNVQLTSNHTIRVGDIPGAGSTLFPNSLFSGTLLSKANFHEGIDLLQRTAHSNGNFNGPYVTHETGGDSHISLDQVFVEELGSQFVHPFMGFMNDSGGCASYALENGAVNQLTGFNSARQAFQSLFGGSNPGGDPNDTYIADRVLEDFKRLKNHSRIGAGDKVTLERAITRIDDIQRRIASTPDCSGVTDPGYRQTWQNFPNRIIDWDLYTSLMVSAMECCIARVGTVHFNRYAHLAGTDFHPESHSDDVSASQDTITSIYTDWVRYFMLPLLTKMDAIIEGNGRTMLDNSFVALTEENTGAGDHSNMGIKLATFGSAGGVFRTGKYFDWRKLDSPYGFSSYYGGEALKPGIALPQFMWTIAKGFGLSDQTIRSYLPTEDTKYSRGGWGAFYVHGNWPGRDGYGNLVSDKRDLLNNHYPQNFSSVLQPMMV